jgi:hypothetical protein
MFESEISVMPCRATKLKVLIFAVSRNRGDMDKKRLSRLYKSKKSSVSSSGQSYSSQDHVDALNLRQR